MPAGKSMKLSKRKSVRGSPTTTNKPHRRTGSGGGAIQGLIMLLVNFALLVYLKKLKECGCVLDKRHQQLKRLVIYNIALPFIIIIVFSLLGLLMNKNKLVALILLIGILAAMIGVGGFYVATLFRYVEAIDKSDCPCIKDDRLAGLHNFVYIWRYIAAFIYGITLLYISIIVIMLAINMMN